MKSQNLTFRDLQSPPECHDVRQIVSESTFREDAYGAPKPDQLPVKPATQSSCRRLSSSNEHLELEKYLDLNKNSETESPNERAQSQLRHYEDVIKNQDMALQA